MLKTDIKWPEDFRYLTKSEWEPIGFFSDALCNATTFDLMLGFFSSAAINVLSYGFASFIYNGGKMRLIVNDILSNDDAFAISEAHEGNDLPYFDLENLEELCYTLNKRDKHFFDCLSWLIRHERIEIKVVRMVNGRGIAHTKCGVFGDGLNKVGFEGSVNFSLSALLHNKESLSVFCDWNGPADEGRINGIQRSFEKTFNGEDEDVEIMEMSQLKMKLLVAEDKKLSDLLEDELTLIERSKDYNLPTTVKKVLDKIKSKVCKDIESIKQEEIKEITPHFPYLTGPRPYQIEAFERWKANGQRGLFAMATGTGKTITALNCLLEIYKRCGYYKAIILVPTLSLVNQWAEECHKFQFNRIIKVCSNNSKWPQDIDEVEFAAHCGLNENKSSYIIICTYSSFARFDVFRRLNCFPKRQLLLIADEAHNMGAGKILKMLKDIPYLRRIGLSATPERHYDAWGTHSTLQFFGCKKEYTYEYSMKEAIENGVLCRYRYFPHIVKLTLSEMEAYLKLSRKLAKYYMYDQDVFRPKDDPILTALLLKRKRILHKASNKLPMFKKIMEQTLSSKGSLQYTLVYVPEGLKPDEFADIYEEEDFIADDFSSAKLIESYTRVVRDLSPTTTVRSFTSESKDRDRILSDFSNGKIEVLTSMKCLDEGIDIPRSEVAVFCASTGNPRQFIQRRGRILRKHTDKYMAEIHDLIVVPFISDSEETYKMERNLLIGELKRVYNFASLSENMNATINEIEDVLNYYKLSIFDV